MLYGFCHRTDRSARRSSSGFAFASAMIIFGMLAIGIGVAVSTGLHKKVVDTKQMQINLAHQAATNHFAIFSDIYTNDGTLTADYDLTVKAFEQRRTTYESFGFEPMQFCTSLIRGYLTPDTDDEDGDGDTTELIAESEDIIVDSEASYGCNSLLPDNGCYPPIEEAVLTSGKAELYAFCSYSGIEDFLTISFVTMAVATDHLIE